LKIKPFTLIASPLESPKTQFPSRLTVQRILPTTRNSVRVWMTQDWMTIPFSQANCISQWKRLPLSLWLIKIHPLVHNPSISFESPKMRWHCGTGESAPVCIRCW
jgi:hypothetical protein